MNACPPHTVCIEYVDMFVMVLVGAITMAGLFLRRWIVTRKKKRVWYMCDRCGTQTIITESENE
jgi:hypothetical protein